MNQAQSVQLDEQLQQLAIYARQRPLHSRERQLALGQLVKAIIQSGKLCRPQWGKFAGFYEDIYDEAVQELLLYICQNLEKYNPERGSVLAWVNVLLERRFFKQAITKIMDRQELQRMELADLDNLVSPESPPRLTEILQQCLELDSENLFKNEHIENYPQANFQVLACRRFGGKSWKEIAAEFQLKIPTLSSFYYRCLKKFAGQIQAYCINNIP